MLVPAETDIRGQLTEQQPFFLVSAANPDDVYCLGVEAPTGVLAVWLDPHSGKPTFGCYLTIQDAAAQLTYKLGGGVPLELVMDDRPADDVSAFSEEVVLTKAVVQRRA